MRVLLPATIVAFSLTSAVQGVLPKVSNATADASIHLYPFVTPDCTGQPFTSPYELKQGECVNMNQARSLRPRFRFDHAEWVQEVNKLQVHCKLETYSDFGCPEANKIDEYQQGLTGDVPKHINSCLVPQHQKKHKEGDGSDSFFSAKFVCSKIEHPQLHCTKLVKQTTWSVDPTYGAPHYKVNTETYTGSLALSAQASTSVEKRFSPGRETKSIWMYHPWSQSLQCYLCYPKKEHDYRKVECRAGHDYPSNCGHVPVFDADGKPQQPPSTTTTTTTTTKVNTIHSTTTVTTTDRAQEAVTDHSDSASDSWSDGDLPRLDFELQQKKSWHTPVKFPHPFIDGKVACADAEWEKRGQIGKDYIKIQKVHICDDKDRDDSQWIGLPASDVRTVYQTKETTTTMLHTEIKVQHDQL